MPEQNTTLIQEEKAAEGVVGSLVAAYAMESIGLCTPPSLPPFLPPSPPLPHPHRSRCPCLKTISRPALTPCLSCSSCSISSATRPQSVPTSGWPRTQTPKTIPHLLTPPPTPPTNPPTCKCVWGPPLINLITSHPPPLLPAVLWGCS